MSQPPTTMPPAPQALVAALAADRDVIVLTDRSGRVVWTNPALQDTLGWSHDQFARCGLELIHPDDAAAGSVAFSRARTEPGHHDLGVVRIFDDRAEWPTFALSQINLLDEHGVVLTRARPTDVAAPAPDPAPDEITGLPGRWAVRAEIDERMQEEYRPFAALFLDLDGFKAINDTYGHCAGDRVLAQVARRLERRLRPDELLVRWGGDEFVVLVDVPGETMAASVAARLQQAITGSPYELDDGDLVRLGVSIGVAFAESPAQVPGLVRDADRSMYEAKRCGGGVLVAIGEQAAAELAS